MSEKREPDEALRERLKAALWHSVGKAIDEMGMRPETADIMCTQQFIASLAEMLWTQLENSAKDLESFANHAGRSTISTDDVLLLTRRNQHLEEVMREFIENEREKKGIVGAGSSKKASGAAGKRKR